MKATALGLTVAAVVGLLIFSLAGPRREPPSPAPAAGTSEDGSLPLREPRFTVASIPYWDQARAVASFRRNIDLIDEITLFWYTLRPDGSIARYEHAEVDRSLVSFARSHGVKTLALVANLPDDSDPVDDWDWRRVDRNIADPAARERHIGEIIALVEDLGVDGVHIDYEKLRDSQTNAFTTFIQELAGALHERGKRLAVTVFPQQAGDRDTHGQDLAALGKVVDELVFIMFDQHYEESKPGPIASISWVTANVDHALALGVPKDVLVLGIPLYGYDWPKGGGAGRGIEYEEVAQLLEAHRPAVRFDRAAASPHFEYADRIVWFENARSSAKKVQLAKRLHLGGVSLWRLGREDPGVWESLKPSAG